MPTHADIEEMFRRVIQQQAGELRSRLAAAMADDREISSVNDALARESRSRLSRIGLDVNEIERSDASHNKEIQRLTKTRKERFWASRPVAHRPNLANSQVPPYGVGVFTSDLSALDYIPGERGDISADSTFPHIGLVYPDDPSRISIAVDRSDGGPGLCLIAQPYIPPTVTAVVWHFVPDASGSWNIDASGTTLHGFYLATANKDWWNCKYAHVIVTSYLRVYQYFWLPERSFTLLDITVQNSMESGLCDKPAGDLVHGVQLQAGDSVMVVLAIELMADVYGSGSHGEINFRDGSNYIEPGPLGIGHYG